MTDDESDVIVELDMPHVILKYPMPNPLGDEEMFIEWEFELIEMLEVEGNLDVVEQTDSGLVVETEDGETEHIDLRELEEEFNNASNNESS